MRPAFFVLACLAALPAGAQTAAEAPKMPGDPHGAAPEWYGMSECASILAVASSRASSRIDRDKFKAGAAQWFASSGDLAAQEGSLPPAEEWAQQIEGWSGRIGSLSSLDGLGDWMSYCAHVGGRNGLPSAAFAKRVPAAATSEPEAEADASG